MYLQVQEKKEAREKRNGKYQCLNAFLPNSYVENKLLIQQDQKWESLKGDQYRKVE